MVETVLVTGGNGFVAGWCIRTLLQRGYAVRTTVRNPAKEAPARLALADAGSSGRLAFFTADLTIDEGWDAAVAGSDYVLHVASPLGGGGAGERDAMIAAARDGTLRVLRAAVKARVKRVVMTSAAAAARASLSSDGISDETVWADPKDPQFDVYRVSKILAEQAAWDYIKTAGGSTEFSTILPGAVFGPILTAENLGSVKIIQGLLQGRPPALPRLGFWITDVRDLAELHIRAMTSSKAAGERFIAAGEFMWMADIASTLRAQLGTAAEKVPSRRLPDFVVKLLMPFMPNLRTLAPLLGRQFSLTADKARRILSFSPLPARTTVVDCARSLLATSGS